MRPSAEHAKQVSSVPYDVVRDAEVRAFVADNPNSFLRVTRAEGDFAEASEPPGDDVFARAKQNLDRLTAEGFYSTDERRAYYLYQLSKNGHSQTGLVGVCSLDEYEQGLIKKHESVRPDKVEDRTDHLLAVRAQTGLIFLAFRGSEVTADLFKKAVRAPAIYDFVCADDIRHRVWRVEDTAPWTEAFRYVPSLYIADGHHRIESALRARDEMRGENAGHNGNEAYNFVLAGMFPAEDLSILPYNRLVKDLNRLSKDDFFSKIRKNFILVSDTLVKSPEHTGDISMYLGGDWYRMRLNPAKRERLSRIDAIDASILQNYVLRPILGVDDPTTDERISFVGGKRGTSELERMVDAGEAKVAFSLYATSMDDLLSVSDSGETMPPKSTWFEPKLKDGLLVYQL